MSSPLFWPGNPGLAAQGSFAKLVCMSQSSPSLTRPAPKLRGRSRLGYALAVLATIAAGLASRHYAGLLPAFLGKYPGDALWALMVFFAWGLIFPRFSSGRIAVLALATSWTVEFLKLWQSPAWSGIRHSTIGHLVFGHAFSWQNLAAYSLGVTGGLLLERMIQPAQIHPAKSLSHAASLH